MAGQYAPISPDPHYSVTEFAPVPPSNVTHYDHHRSRASSFNNNNAIPPSPSPLLYHTDSYNDSIGGGGSYSPQEKKTNRLAARSVSSFFSRKSVPEHEYTTESRPRSYTWHFVSHIFSFLWLGPIIALLVLNFRSTIIGSSAWCPLGRCPSRVWETNAVARAKQLDEDDHNILGTLQFIAKALEVWFMFIVTSLIYDLAMILARSRGGLPIGFLLTHLQFTDLRNLLNLHLWTAAKPPKTAPKSQRESGGRLMMFGIFVAVLTVLANMMGPAAAVLLIPTLRWVDTEHVAAQSFVAMHADQLPKENEDLYPLCSASNFSAGEFSCSGEQQKSSFDSVATWEEMTKQQSMKKYGQLASAPIQESTVQFLVNYTANTGVTWGASRQVLQELSHDLFQLANPDKFGEPLAQLNDSLKVNLNKERPSIGFDGDCNKGYEKVVNITDDKQVRCYTDWTNGINTYTKCFQVGEGFGPANKLTNFWIQTLYKDQPDGTRVDLFFSERVTFYNSTTDFNSGIANCLDPAKAPTPSCDWDKIFSTPMPLELKNLTRNAFMTSYSFYFDESVLDPDVHAASAPTANSRMYCDAISYLSYPVYTVDTSLSDGVVVPLVKLDRLAVEKGTEPIVLDPSWALLAWSVDRNDSIRFERPIAQVLQDLFPRAWATNFSQEVVDAGTEDYSDWLALYFLNTYFFTQTISIIPYDFDDLPFGSNVPSGYTVPKGNASHPTLKMWATRHVWTYGLSGSRSSKLGVSVAIAGILCVLFRLFLGLVGAGKREHSPVELMVAALEHHPTGEFEEIRGDVGRMAKVRYVMQEDEEGRARFVPERQFTGEFIGEEKKRKMGKMGSRVSSGLEGLMGGATGVGGLGIAGRRTWSWKGSGGRERGESVSTLVNNEGREAVLGGEEREGLKNRAVPPAGVGTPALGSGGWVGSVGDGRGVGYEMGRM